MQSEIAASGWQGEAVNPAAALPRTLSVQRRGFDATGSSTVTGATLQLTRRVRQVYPNQNMPTSSTIALSDYLYASDTVPGAANASVEVSPKPIAAWVMPCRLLVGAFVRWELVAFHIDAREGRQVAAVRVRANNGTAQTAWQTVSATALSTLAEDAQPIEVYGGDLDVTALPDGLFWLEAEVCPWIGAAPSVLRSEDQGDPREFARRYFTKDTARAAAPPLVYVSAGGNNATGLCSTNAATAKASPFADVQGAITGALAATAVTGGKLDGVRVRIMAGNNIWGAFNNAINRRQDSAALVIERDPDSPRASCVLQQSASVSLKMGYSGTNVSSLTAPLTEAAVILRDVSYQRTAAGQIGNDGTGANFDFQLWNTAFDNGAVTGTWMRGAGGFRLYGVVFANLGSFFTYGATAVQRLHRGVTATVAATSFETWVQVGCRLTGHSGGAFRDPTKGMIVYNCVFPAPSTGNSPVQMQAVNAGDTITGVAVVQNLIEVTHTTSSSPAMRLSSDNQNGSIVHAVVQHNTVTGYGILGRQNLFYDEASGTNRRNHRLVRCTGNIFVQLNTKGDVFVGANQNRPDEAPFRTGNFAFSHGVGCQGNWTMFQVSAVGSEGQVYPGPGSVIGASTTVRNDPLFVDYRGTGGSGGTPSAGAGGGDYRLQPGSPARGIVAQPVLTHDLAGVARRAEAQAAGAYA